MLYRIENCLKQRDREQGYRLHIRCLRVPRGARIAITGPSGCGKSTTLDLLGLALEPDAAETFSFSPDGTPKDIGLLWRRQCHDVMAALRLRHMGYVLQTGELLPFLSVGENMTLTARMSGVPREAALAAAHDLARQLDIEHLMRAMPGTLSVGERQRAAIVRALTPHPSLILADEPTAALDPVHAAGVMDAFLGAVDDQGGTLILVTHNAEWTRGGGLSELPFSLEKDSDGVTAVLDDGNALTAPVAKEPPPC